MLRTLAITLIVGLLISGCQATGKPFKKITTSEDQAVLYIYRPNGGPGGKALEYPEMWVNDKSIGTLKVDGYMVVKLPVDEHAVKATGLTEQADWSFRDITRHVNAKAGQEYYLRLLVRYDPDSNRIGSPGMDHLVLLTPVDGSEAIYEIKDTRLSD